MLIEIQADIISKELSSERLYFKRNNKGKFFSVSFHFILGITNDECGYPEFSVYLSIIWHLFSATSFDFLTFLNFAVAKILLKGFMYVITKHKTFDENQSFCLEFIHY